MYGSFWLQAVGKTEDGIFGTSGGIGFTKANELFVGRVAMLGFAVSTLIKNAIAMCSNACLGCSNG
jgi:hypothetical protein